MAILSSDLIRQGAAGASTGYTIDQSIRFAFSDSAYMHRTVGSGGNTQTWTFSCWFKLGKLTSARGASSFLWSCHQSDGNRLQLSLDSGTLGNAGDFLSLYDGASASTIFRTTRAFRDVAAWYHLVLVADTTNATSSQRFRVYVNGERELSFSTIAYPSVNANLGWNQNGSTYYLADYFSNHDGTYSFDGYLAEINHVDGTAYGPEYFGENDENGIWIPKEYTGSYGTKGFFIDGRDSSDLGDDESGNGNDFTTSGLAANDQRVDTPTNNQITFNPLNNQRSGGNPQDGNLVYDGPGTRTLISLTANIPPTGKWAVAFSVAAVSTNVGWQFGITKATNTNFGDAAGSNEDVGGQDNDGVQMSPSSSDLQLYDYITSTSIDPSLPITTSDEFWVAVDMATGKCFLGIYDASATAMKFVAADTGLDGNPATGDNPTATISAMIGSNDYTFAVGSKDTSNDITLLRSTEVSGTTPTGYTYFENVKDLI